ncbi:hypothetical protein BJY04DRAFT_220375 [Aspergillus karnatakaensis]|uniref:CFEM domain-containing protein n=1 Tax=Aspergillus karnatakaensis TaxID=1810916 RepID=UPI003CCCF4B3
MDGLPSCALLCLTQAIPSSSCRLLDIGCVCQNAQLIAQIQSCGLQNCTIKDNLRSTRFLYDTCDYPVTVDNKVFPVVLTTGIILSAIAVTLRIAGRLIGSKLGFDDGVAVLSLVVALAITAIGFVYLRLGLGTDIWFLPFHDITHILHLYFVEEALYIASIALSKISMLLLYLRLFPDERFRLASKGVLTFTTAWGLAILFTNIFSCQPLNYFWHMWDGGHEGHCIDHAALIWSHAIINIVLDVVIIALPMPTLLALNLSCGRKAGICVMFAGGIVVTVVSILRFVSSLSFDMTDNPTKNFVSIGVWSLLEVYLSIICACMPGIRAFFNYTYSKLGAKISIYDSFAGRGSAGVGIPSPAPVRSGTFQSANREQGEFIRLQEIESAKT